MDEALKALDKEIRWFESHRDYFQTSACADTAISRLRGRREQIERILKASGCASYPAPARTGGHGGGFGFVGG
jgi:hypothetical protein